jgi:hypothetical protein
LTGGAAPAAKPAAASPKVAVATEATPEEAAAEAEPAEPPQPNEVAAAEPPAEAEMDPELAALLQQIEGGAAPAAEAPPAEEMDPELAALLQQIESGTPMETPSPPPEAAAPAEEMDPELAALMQQLESGAEVPPPAPPAEAPAPAAEEMDPELAALMQQLEAGGTEGPPTEPATEAPASAAEEMDPELAALMQQLETGSEVAPPAPPVEAPAAAAEEMDPELAALMKQLETGAPDEAVAAAPASSPEPAPEPDLQAEIDSLGGLAALEALGWPTFAPVFTQDQERLVRLLRKRTTNKAVEKEVADLAKKCGGYAALAGDGIRPDQPLHIRLQKLRDFKKVQDADQLLHDEDLLSLAGDYGASMKKVTDPRARAELLAQVRDHHQWAGDARNAGLAAALEGCPFKERRQAQLEQQLTALGGDSAFAALKAAHPAGLPARATADHKVALLQTSREYTRLGGDDRFAGQVGGDPQVVALTVKLEQLKTVLAARE